MGSPVWGLGAGIPAKGEGEGQVAGLFGAVCVQRVITVRECGLRAARSSYFQRYAGNPYFCVKWDFKYWLVWGLGIVLASWGKEPIALARIRQGCFLVRSADSHWPWSQGQGVATPHQLLGIRLFCSSRNKYRFRLEKGVAAGQGVSSC